MVVVCEAALFQSQWYLVLCVVTQGFQPVCDDDFLFY